MNRPLPRPVKQVPRDEVGECVQIMLSDPDVETVICVKEDDDDTFTVTPG